jgi:hypothetical protein
MLDEKATHRHVGSGDFFLLELVGVRIVVVKRAAVEDVQTNRLRLLCCGLLSICAAEEEKSE